MNPFRVILFMAFVVSILLVLLEWTGDHFTDNATTPVVVPVAASFDQEVPRSETFRGIVYPWRCPPWRSAAQFNQSPAVTDKTVDVPDVNNIDFMETTSPKFTIVNIVNRQVVYQPCDVLIVKIEARNWRNKPKNYGGDFFRLKIFSEDPYYSAAGEDEIIDLRNGTYLAYFILRWSGEVNVQIKLIHPVELLPQMSLTLSGKIGLNVTFIGEFKSNEIAEEVICRYVELEPPFCNLSNPLTHGPWFCQRPKDPRLTCHNWKFHKMYKGTFLKLEENLSQLSKSLLKKSHMVEIGAKLSVLVDGVFLQGDSEERIWFELPYCVMEGAPAGIHTSGHFFRNRWYPHNCRVFDFSVDTGIKCLSHKNLVFLGDSTIRQVFEYFRDIYKNHLEQLPLPQGACKEHGPLELKGNKQNTSVKYHFHGLPSSGTGLVLRTDNIEYIADRLNSGKDGCDVVYVLSLWAHFIATGKNFYAQRLLAIKHAVLAFLDRCPKSKVIIKGANTKDHPALWIAIVSSEWNIVQHELKLRKMFQNEKRVGFIDALDVTKVQPYKDNVHPDRRIVKEFVNRILTYICKNS